MKKQKFNNHLQERSKLLIILSFLLSFSPILYAQKPSKENKVPVIHKPILFNTPEADKIIEATQIFPPTSAYNEDISQRPVAENSEAIISGKFTSTFGYNLDMGYVIVPPNQTKVHVEVYMYPDESDPGPYPIPDNTPIEEWPVLDKNFRKDDFPLRSYYGQSLYEIQRKGRGDRHALLLDPYAKKVYEFYNTYRTDTGWRAGQASIFDLSSNKMRPKGWTSTDAAGLSVFAATVRYSDVKNGIVPHVIRVTVKHTRNEYVYPATHAASKLTDINLPRMGERFRLKKNVDVSKFSPDAKAIALGMKKYGLIVADNGGSSALDWLISITPDNRLKGLQDLYKLSPSDFEVIVPTGPEGYGR